MMSATVLATDLLVRTMRLVSADLLLRTCLLVNPALLARGRQRLPELGRLSHTLRMLRTLVMSASLPVRASQGPRALGLPNLLLRMWLIMKSPLTNARDLVVSGIQFTIQTGLCPGRVAEADTAYCCLNDGGFSQHIEQKYRGLNAFFSEIIR